MNEPSREERVSLQCECGQKMSVMKSRLERIESDYKCPKCKQPVGIEQLNEPPATTVTEVERYQFTEPAQKESTIQKPAEETPPKKSFNPFAKSANENIDAVERVNQAFKDRAIDNKDKEPEPHFTNNGCLGSVFGALLVIGGLLSAINENPIVTVGSICVVASGLLLLVASEALGILAQIEAELRFRRLNPGDSVKHAENENDDRES